ncbi:MAG TPA: ATP-binding protein [Gaiellaceae bacterium]|jgi:signal transduction histidine kinase
MRWWLGLAFAAVAGFTAFAVVTVFSARAEDAFWAHAREFAVGNAVASSEAIKDERNSVALRTEAAEIAARRGISLFVFDRSGRLLTPAVSESVQWTSVPDHEEALRVPLGNGRYIGATRDGSSYIVGIRVYGDPARALVAYSRRPELQEQLSVIRQESLQSALVAFGGGAALGLLIATLIARRLTRIAQAAKAIGEGDFSERVESRFPDEVGSLAASIEGMRVQLEQLFGRLEHDRDRLESLLDRLNEGVLLVNGELGIEFANGRALELLGVWDHLDQCQFADGHATNRLRRFALDLFSVQLPAHLRLEDGDRTLVVAGIPPATRGDDAIVVVVDESERERNERVQREFATNAAHELRTPLASIVTAVEMLQTGAKDDPTARDEFLEVIARESDRLTRLTRALLVLARAEAQQERPQITSVQVAPLLEEVAATLPRRDGVRIGIDCPATLTIAGDPDLLEQAISSLASNAVRYTASGSVEMRGRQENGSVVIEVADTGRGIPDAERQRIFERFYRGGGEQKGFGLGLAIAREAVRTLGGEIELESEQTVGTTIRIRLATADGEER